MTDPAITAPEVSDDQHEALLRQPELTDTRPHLLPFKVAKTVFMISIWIFVGLSVSMITPSVDDLRRQVNCNYEELTYALAFRGLGTIAGALSLGVLNERFKGYTDILIGVELCLGGISLAALPWMNHLSLLGVGFSSLGFACGGLSASGNAHVVYMWGEKASAPVHIVHFGFGLGTVIGPLLVGPFIAHDISPNKTSSLDDPMDAISYPLSHFKEYSIDAIETDVQNKGNMTESHIYIPYGICGGFSLTCGLIFMALFLLPLNKLIYQRQINTDSTHQSLRTLLHPGSCSEGKLLFSVQMFSLLLILYILIVSKDALINTFIYAIAVDTDMGFTPWQGVLITTVYWVCYAVSRLVFAFIGHFVRIQIMIFVEMGLVLIAHVSLACWGLTSQLAYWLTMCAFGFTAGPVYPSGMAFIDRYLTMTPAAFSVLDIGIGIGALFSTWLSGVIFQRGNSVELFYVSLGCGIGITVVLIIMQILGSMNGDRYDRARQQLNASHIQDVDQLTDDLIPRQQVNASHIQDVEHLIDA